MNQGKQRPLDSGRLCYVSGTYASNEIDPNTRQPKTKNRYAPVGRVTAWPNDNGGALPKLNIELESLPLGVMGSVNLFVFWDSDSKQTPQNLGNFQQPTNYQQAQQQQPQAQSYGSWPQQNQGAR